MNRNSERELRSSHHRLGALLSPAIPRALAAPAATASKYDNLAAVCRKQVGNTIDYTIRIAHDGMAAEAL